MTLFNEPWPHHHSQSIRYRVFLLLYSLGMVWNPINAFILFVCCHFVRGFYHQTTSRGVCPSQSTWNHTSYILAESPWNSTSFAVYPVVPAPILSRVGAANSGFFGRSEAPSLQPVDPTDWNAMSCPVNVRRCIMP